MSATEEAELKGGHPPAGKYCVVTCFCWFVLMNDIMQQSLIKQISYVTSWHGQNLVPAGPC